MSASTRRAALGAILAAPLASAPATASSVSPKLAQIIAEHDAHRAVMDDHPEDEAPTREDCRKAGRLRARIVRFPSLGWADTMAKAACLARLYPLRDAEEDLACELKDNHAYLDAMALNIVVEVMQLGEGTLCA